MKTRLTLLFLIGLVTAHSTASPAQASVIIWFTEVGSDVVATGSGTIDLTELAAQSVLSLTAGVRPGFAEVTMGPTSASTVGVFTGISGPASFGTGTGLLAASSGTGDVFGVSGLAGTISVPFDKAIAAGNTGVITLSAATNTYAGATFTSLGLTPGTYTWTWGTGTSNADFLTVHIGAAAVPEPSSLVLGVTGAAFAGLVLYRRRRRARA